MNKFDSLKPLPETREVLDEDIKNITRDLRFELSELFQDESLEKLPADKLLRELLKRVNNPLDPNFVLEALDDPEKAERFIPLLLAKIPLELRKNWLKKLADKVNKYSEEKYEWSDFDGMEIIIEELDKLPAEVEADLVSQLMHMVTTREDQGNQMELGFHISNVPPENIVTGLGETNFEILENPNARLNPGRGNSYAASEDSVGPALYWSRGDEEGLKNLYTGKYLYIIEGDKEAPLEPSNRHFSASRSPVVARYAIPLINEKGEDISSKVAKALNVKFSNWQN